MKVAFVSEHFYPYFKGGAEKRFYETASRLSHSGHDVHWYAGKDWHGKHNIEMDGIHYHGLVQNRNHYTNTGRRSIIKAIFYGVQWIYQIKEINRYEFDLVNCSLYPFFHCFVFKLLLRKRIKFVITWYEFWGDYWYEYLGILGIFGKFIELITLNLPDAIIAVSEKVYKKITRINNKQIPIKLITNGVNIDLIRNVKPSESNSDIIYVGRLKNHKNVDILLQTVKLLKESRPNLRVLIVGDGPEMENLKKLAYNLDINSVVRFTGCVDSDIEVFSLMKSSKIFVHPSSKEGGGSLALLEANACGRPVIAFRTDLGIDEDLIIDSKNGYWVDELKPESFAKKITALLSNDFLLSNMTKSSISFVEEYSWSNIFVKNMNFYEEIIGNERA